MIRCHARVENSDADILTVELVSCANQAEQWRPLLRANQIRSGCSRDVTKRFHWPIGRQVVGKTIRCQFRNRSDWQLDLQSAQLRHPVFDLSVVPLQRRKQISISDIVNLQDYA